PSSSLFFGATGCPVDLRSFPTRRSSDLVDDLERRRLAELFVEVLEQAVTAALHDVAGEPLVQGERVARDRGLHAVAEVGGEGGQDRKSTRLNSSHLGISYAVFCLKKKKD